MPSASSRQTAVRPSTNAAYDRLVDRTRRSAPLASSITRSLVEHSPSTVIALNVSLTASRSARCSSGCGTAASVVTNASIVAIIGSIMPEPLAIPPIATSRPSMHHARRRFLRERIGRHDGARGSRALIGAERRERRAAARS